MVQTADPRSARQRRLAAALAVAGSLIVAAAFAGTTLYKWVDENGVVHYSDQPHPGAEKIQVAKAQTYAAPPVPKTVKPPATTTKAVAHYDRLQFSSPVNNDVLLNTGGIVPFAVDLEPGLAPGDSLWFTLDGVPINGLSPEATSGTLVEVERGQHTLVVQVVDANGTVLANSEPVTFMLRQPSAIRQAQPVPYSH